MMSPNKFSEDRGGSSPNHFRHTPLQIIHVVANFMRIWSIYSMYRYFSQTGASVVLFLFTCLAPASILFLILQKPWKGRPLSNTQVVPSVINGAITALYLVLWGKGLKSCGPVRAILAEYSGAVLGVLSAVLYGRRSHMWKKEVEPVSVIPESPIDLSSAAASANDAHEDPVFTNFYSTSKVTGHYAPNVESFGQPYHFATVTSAPSGLMPVAPTEQILSASRQASSISGVPLDSIETMNSGNQVTNLLKPSTFFSSTSSSSLLIPPIYSHAPPTTALNSLNQPRQYGTPMLQPFPPPNPPPSLAPISSSTPNKPVISRDKVRDAI